MKVKIQDIADAVDFNSDMSQSYLNIKTGEICVYVDDELQAAENNEDVSGSPEWYREAVAKAKQYVDNPNDYLYLPEKFDFNEYRVMEKFISHVQKDEHAEALFKAIKGKGAFHRFKAVLERFSLTGQWYEYKNRQLQEFIEFWCKENDIEF